jgi:hypothetical protein
MSDELETLLARVVAYHLDHGELPAANIIAGDRPDLAAPLWSLAQQYVALTSALEHGAPADDAAPAPAPLVVEGFQTIERLGAGGMGEVYKLRDLTLDRFVAAKVIRADRRARTALAEFLEEARSMALFEDRRVVQIHELRDDADPPVIIMEFVDGFELGRIGPSLEFGQRARILRDVCGVIHRAHELGIQHRDLKPSNIMVDNALAPKVLDFGLSHGNPHAGHLRGTPAYLAPEQLELSRPIDARTDVYALGVILYELIAGVTPFDAADTTDLLDAIARGVPRLPTEIDPRVPEPLQAIALKAMDRDPAGRYQSARDMALDLTRYLDGRPVVARPAQYATSLASRTRVHLDHIAEWLRLKLIYPHEADRLQQAYRRLDAREDDWIAAARTLSYSQIALYFGALLLTAGSLFYFTAHYDGAVVGFVRPFLVLAVPWIAVNAAGWRLFGTGRQAVAVAFFLAGVTLLPLVLLIWLHEAHIWAVPHDAPNQLLAEGGISNRQLQLITLLASAWAGWLALRTRTTALSTVFVVLLLLVAVSVLSSFGLRSWIENNQWDRVALHLWPLALVYAALGVAGERTARAWLSTPLYIGAIAVLVASLDLLALDGRTMAYLDLSLHRFQSPHDTVSIDTLAALTMNGLAFYFVAVALERWGSDLMMGPAALLLLIAPFSSLEPLAYLVDTKDYLSQIDWLYLALAATTAIVSHHRQRKGFYYAGLLNATVALYCIADRRQWFDRPLWGAAIVAAGLAVLAAGFALDVRERRDRAS